MRAAVFKGPYSISVADRPDPAIAEPADAVVRVVLSCVCGSDLWFYRGDSPFEPGPIGHEFIGVVEEVGVDVNEITKGDFVICPFAFSDGTCPHCRHGVTSACAAGGFFRDQVAAAGWDDVMRPGRARSPSIVDSITDAEHCSTTLRLVPR
jgi:threonine dehydrogenase-like Zn-dependent dehydrogenase